MVNTACGRLRKISTEVGLIPVPVEQSVAARRRLCLEKTHALGAISVAAAMTGAFGIDQRDALDMDMTQYRRHRRAHIHAQRDRLYYLPKATLQKGEKKKKVPPVAHNRRKRCDQGDVDSLAEFRKAHPKDVGRLEVKEAVRLYTPSRAKAAAVGGDVWKIAGRRVVAHGVHSKINLSVPDLKPITGKVYASPKDGVRLLWNAGMVVT